jgi:hypothetical protein
VTATFNDLPLADLTFSFQKSTLLTLCQAMRQITLLKFKESHSHREIVLWTPLLIVNWDEGLLPDVTGRIGKLHGSTIGPYLYITT